MSVTKQVTPKAQQKEKVHLKEKKSAKVTKVSEKLKELNEPVAVAVVEPEPVAVTESVVESVVEPVTESVVEPVAVTEKDTFKMRERCDTMVRDRLEQITKLRDEIKDIRKLQKDYDLEMKAVYKKFSKKGSKKSNRSSDSFKNNGFSKPVPLSDKMYKFLEQYSIKQGDLVARKDVTKFINQYIKEHNLYNPANKREITPDTLLQEILGDSVETRSDDPSIKIYTYFKLQKYLAVHYPKQLPVT